MKLTKKDIAKLKIFSEYLQKYLDDWTSKNCFYYADDYQKSICDQLIDDPDSFKYLDKNDKNTVKDMLRTIAINYKANKNSQLHYYKFNYVKMI